MTTAPDPGLALETPAGRRHVVDGVAELDDAGGVLRHLPLCAGCFALILAALLPLYVYPRLAVLPADPGVTQVQAGSHGTVLVADLDAPAGARVVRDVDVRVTTHVSAAPSAADDDSVVWRLATRTTAAGHGLVDARVETVSLDRRTAEPTNCCGDRLVTDEADPAGEPVHHRGYVAWPFDVQKRAYDVWDVQLNRPRTAAFIGEERRDGLRTYKFQAVTPLERIGTQVLPGRLFGVRAPSVEAAAEYGDTRTFWIEPATGNVVDLHEVLRQQFSYAGRVVPAISATLESPALDGDLLRKTQQGALVLPWLRGRASLVLLVVGLALLTWWFHRSWRTRPMTVGGGGAGG